VIDRSGSMSGTPMAQAKKAVAACLGALGAEDRFGLVAFDDHVELFGGGIVEASREQRDSARRFLDSVDSRGGTNLAAGFLEASRMLGNEGGDVMVLTDGQVAGTEQILSKARATGIRIHLLGIGSASEDRFLAQLAKETGGVSRFVTPRERVDMAAVELFSSIGRPVAAGIAITGAEIEPQPPGAVHAGTPLVIYGSTESAESSLRIAWEGGRALDLPLRLQASPLAETARLLRGARLITDFESRYSEESQTAGTLEKRKAGRAATRLKALSEEYGLASREMSLIAVVKRGSDRPGEIPETRVVPVGMAQDVLFGSYFGSFSNFLDAASGPPMVAPHPDRAARRSLASLARSGGPEMFARSTSMLTRPRPDAASRWRQDPAAPPDSADRLLDLAARIEPDGGMPGARFEDRIAATLEALRDFLQEGHTAKAGAFRRHVKRLAEFVRASLSKLDSARRTQAEELLRQAGVTL
jgi:Ca-activated chloride channel family protein